MRVFVTGASGHIGSAVVAELIAAGHQVVGLARSDASAAAVAAQGAEVRRGELADLDGLRAAATQADGVIHLAFDHAAMFSGDQAGAVAGERRAAEAMGDALAGSGKPLITVSGTLSLASAGLDRAGTEQDVLDSGPRVDTENAVIALAGRGVRSAVVRLSPLVHSSLDRHGFTPTLITIARTAGFAGYVGAGTNRWPAVHTLDAARLFRLAVESAPAGARLHAVGDQGVPFREIAEAIGRQLDVPAKPVAAEDAGAHFGFLGGLVGLDNPTSNAHTRELLGWQPTHPGLIADIEQGHYFTGTAS